MSEERDQEKDQGGLPSEAVRESDKLADGQEPSVEEQLREADD